jgi:arsenate reductase (glutaredoxin)
MSIVIYHNPACETSRNVLAMIRQSGAEPEIIEYLKTPPARERLNDSFRQWGFRSVLYCAKKALLIMSLA